MFFFTSRGLIHGMKLSTRDYDKKQKSCHSSFLSNDFKNFCNIIQILCIEFFHFQKEYGIIVDCYPITKSHEGLFNFTNQKVTKFIRFDAFNTTYNTYCACYKDFVVEILYTEKF